LPSARIGCIWYRMPFRVLVDDNFHFMDESERYELGAFATLEEALTASCGIVDEFLLSAYKPGMTAQQLYFSYTSFGEDPFIIPDASEETAVEFSAWDYAKRRCEVMCAQQKG
jgi:hypothetical protein